MGVYNKNCGKKIFGKKIYPAPGGNLANPVAFKNMGGKITKLMLKWVPTPNKNLTERRVPMKKQIQKLLNIDDNFTIKDVKVQGEENPVSGKSSYSYAARRVCFP